MKRITIALLFLLMLMCGCSAEKADGTADTSAAEEKEDQLGFTLINMTDTEFTSVRISVANLEKWSGNVLDGGKFLRGSERVIEYPDLSDAEMYDIKCEAKNGAATTYTELPLSIAKSIMLTADEMGMPVPVITEKDGAEAVSAAQGETEAEETHIQYTREEIQQ